MAKRYSIIIPAYNEADAIGPVLQELLKSDLNNISEIIVVNDSSTDETARVAESHKVRVLHNVHNFGYGYSLKRGIAAAEGEHIIILDADGSYPVASLQILVQEYEKGFDMVVGARQGHFYRGSLVKRVGRYFFRVLSEFATGRHIPDINSGCRVFRKSVAVQFFPTLSSGFSFTTTITLAFMLNAYSVHYVPIEYHKRTGSSKVRYLRDTLRSLQIIVEAITIYNPLKMFLLLALVTFIGGLAATLLSVWYPMLALMLFLATGFTAVVFSLGLLSILVRHGQSNA